MMEAVRTSETSVYSNKTTRHYIPEGCHHQTRRRENLKSHTIWKYVHDLELHQLGLIVDYINSAAIKRGRDNL
jgi:hypothetical protein